MQLKQLEMLERELEYSLENLAAFSEETWFSDTLCSERLIEIMLLPGMGAAPRLSGERK